MAACTKAWRFPRDSSSPPTKHHPATHPTPTAHVMFALRRALASPPRATAATAATSRLGRRRTLASSSNNFWLNDKSVRRRMFSGVICSVLNRAYTTQPPPPPPPPQQVYPLLGITAVACLVAAWYGPYSLYKSPEYQTPMRRRTTAAVDGITQKQPYEHTPANEDIYKKAEAMTKGIYHVTIKDKGGNKEE